MSNPGVVTLSTLRTLAQQRADMENDPSIQTSEWNNYINASYAELYDILVQKFGSDYYFASDANGKGYQFSTNGTSQQFALPDGSSTYKMPDATTAPAFYKLLGVDLQLAGTPDGWITLHPYNFLERNRFSFPNIQAAYGFRSNLRYTLKGNFIWFTPTPASGQTLQIWYAPRLTAMSSDSDTMDGVSGWEEYVVVDVAIKALIKQERDIGGVEAQKAQLLHRIEAAATNRDAGSPQTVSDVRRGMSGWAERDGSPWGGY